MIGDLAHIQACLRPLRFLVLRHLREDLMEANADRPDWCRDLGLDPATTLNVTLAFPYLSVFVDEARAWWREGKSELLPSGIWCEPRVGNEDGLHLEAAALTLGGLPLLLVGPHYFDLGKVQQVLQKTRELHLDHEALERAQNALRASEQRQRAILDALPDRYVLFDAQGVIHHHNDVELPRLGKTGVLTLVQFVGEDAALSLLEKSVDLHVGDGAQTLEFERAFGDGSRLFEARLVPMGEGQTMCLVRDISEARELERRKAEFLSLAGHELRTPLTAIKGGLSMVLTGMEGELPELAVNMIRIASRNSERLVSLINDLLDIQKIELSSRSFKRARINARVLLKRAVEDNQPFAHELGRRLVLDREVENVYILADFRAMIQVLTNLISNAVKFSPEGETIRIGGRLMGDQVDFYVADNGPGIPEAFRNRIFEKFASIPGSEQAPVKGTGLGLSLCKAIVDEHLGSLTFETETGVGTTFHMRLQQLMGDEPDDLPQGAA